MSKIATFSRLEEKLEIANLIRSDILKNRKKSSDSPDCHCGKIPEKTSYLTNCDLKNASASGWNSNGFKQRQLGEGGF